MRSAKSQLKQLRNGFTTGACATAATKAAWLAFNNTNAPLSIPVEFPDKTIKYLRLKSIKKYKDSAVADIVKPENDDLDVTKKILISVSIRKITNKEISSHDHIIKINKSIFVIRGGKGIGLVTRDGLKVKKNKWAINPAPLKMIKNNLSCLLLSSSQNIFLITISAKNGEKIARQTLNPTLGIIGGISIIGTTGIVVPYSNRAYINTIKILIKAAQSSNSDHIVLCTGSSTENAIKQIYSNLKENSIIRISDFIYQSLYYASRLDFKKISIACMPGKLLKYAQGFRNTHANFNRQDFSLLANLAKKITQKESLLSKIENSKTINEALSYLKRNQQSKLLLFIAKIALNNFKTWTNHPQIEILIFSQNDSQLLLKTTYEK